MSSYISLVANQSISPTECSSSSFHSTAGILASDSGATQPSTLSSANTLHECSAAAAKALPAAWVILVDHWSSRIRIVEKTSFSVLFPGEAASAMSILLESTPTSHSQKDDSGTLMRSDFKCNLSCLEINFSTECLFIQTKFTKLAFIC